MTHSENGNCAIWRLTDAINRIDGAYYFCAKHMGVKENTLALLFALDDGKPHSQTQIAREWLIPKTTVNTVVKELTQAGYITLVGTERSREKDLRRSGYDRDEAGRAASAGPDAGPVPG